MGDVMLLGVLRMPYEMAMGGELARIQFHSRAKQAADRIEADAAEIANLRAELEAVTAERDTARAETAMAVELAFHAGADWALDRDGCHWEDVLAAITPAHATAALAARDKATREAALRECVAYHQGEIDRLDAQIADNEAYMKRSGRGVSEANKFCRDQQSSHRISRDAILALI